MKSTDKLIELGIPVDTPPAVARFNDITGTFSKDRNTLCLMIEDNGGNLETFEGCILPKETVKQIALTVNTLYTNYGCEVHSHTMKQTPFKNLKILKENG